jgi:glycogenin glucosyltransferase
MIMSNPEAVFERDVAFAAAPDIFPPDRFNAGVLLIVSIPGINFLET